MLFVQHHHLISHLRTEHSQKGRSLFRDERAFVDVSRAFIYMLKDSHLLATCFIVDALDECDQGLADLLELISTSLELTDKVKWLVRSCPEVNVLASRGCDPRVEGESRVSVARAKGVACVRRDVKWREKVRRRRAAHAKVSTCAAKKNVAEYVLYPVLHVFYSHTTYLQ
jgi:hypothetical protein